MTVQEVKAVLNGARDSVRAYRLAKDKLNAYKQLLTSGKTARYESDGSILLAYTGTLCKICA